MAPYAQTNGITTFYRQEGSGPAVVLIHGHSAGLAMWRYQVRPLVAAGFRVLRYDVRGHGRSQAPAAGYTWEEYAADLGDLLDHLGHRQAHLVGISMGGGIALQLAAESPQRVSSLTLVDSALPGYTYSEEFTRDIESLVAAVRSEGPRAAFERLWLPHPFFDGIRRFPKRFAAIRQIVLAYQAPDYKEGAIPAGYRPELASRLPEIGAPALVVVGEHDILDFRLIAEILAANIPRARLHVMAGCWHLPPLEDPESFNRVLISFLREVSPTVAATR